MSEKNQHAVELSKLGASKGGRARAASLSAERRSEIARNAVAARWSKRDTNLIDLAADTWDKLHELEDALGRFAREALSQHIAHNATAWIIDGSDDLKDET